MKATTTIFFSLCLLALSLISANKAAATPVVDRDGFEVMKNVRYNILGANFGAGPIGVAKGTNGERCPGNVVKKLFAKPPFPSPVPHDQNKTSSPQNSAGDDDYGEQLHCLTEHVWGWKTRRRCINTKAAINNPAVRSQMHSDDDNDGVDGGFGALECKFNCSE